MPCSPVRYGGGLKENMMNDILWLAAIVGMLAATLAYVRLCDAA